MQVKHAFLQLFQYMLHRLKRFETYIQKKYVSMIRKYHNHKLQTTPWHRKEKLLNHHETPERQIKQSNQLSLPHQDDCNTRTDIKFNDRSMFVLTFMILKAIKAQICLFTVQAY